jgi:hypothetical protein
LVALNTELAEIELQIRALDRAVGLLTDFTAEISGGAVEAPGTTEGE